MRILVTGAVGFIGAEVIAALRGAGHEVVRAVRAARRAQADDIACDFTRDVDAEAWLPRLAGIDAVINCAGILREIGRERFETIHVATPLALAHACAMAGIARFVQISALGNADDGDYVMSKHRGDAAILRELPRAVILRPGLIYSTHGAYGGTSLLRGIAALPAVMPLPEGGRQGLQPMDVRDLAQAVLASLDREAAQGQVIELAGPRVMSLREYLSAWRSWLGLRDARVLTVPAALTRLGAELGERFGRGPVGRTTTRMLNRGVVAAGDALARMHALLELSPRDLRDNIALHPAQQQDRLAARLYFVVPLLIAMLCVTWIVSGLIGLLLPGAAIAHAMAGAPWPDALTLPLARGAGAVDLWLGVALMARSRNLTVLKLMFAQALLYTLVLGVAMPALWLDPWGGLLKNLIVLPALLVALASADRH